MSARQAGTVAMLGITWVVAASIALHFLDQDLDPVTGTLSQYARPGPYWWLQNSSDLAFAIGVLAIALRLRQTLALGRWVRPSIAPLVVVGVAFIVAGAFDPAPIGATQSTVAGSLHATAAMLAVACGLIAVWLLRGVFSRDPSWRRMSGAELWFAVAITLATVATFVAFGLSAESGGAPVGVAQRIVIAAILAWLATLAWQLRTVRGVRGGAP